MSINPHGLGVEKVVYTYRGGGRWVMLGYCPEPSVIMLNLQTGERLTFGLGGSLAQAFEERNGETCTMEERHAAAFLQSSYDRQFVEIVRAIEAEHNIRDRILPEALTATQKATPSQGAGGLAARLRQFAGSAAGRVARELCEEAAALLEAVGKAGWKVVYQIRIKGSDEWRDHDKETTEFYAKLKAETRVLYTCHLPQEAPQDEQRGVQ